MFWWNKRTSSNPSLRFLFCSHKIISLIWKLQAPVISNDTAIISKNISMELCFRFYLVSDRSFLILTNIFLNCLVFGMNFFWSFEDKFNPYSTWKLFNYLKNGYHFPLSLLFFQTEHSFNHSNMRWLLRPLTILDRFQFVHVSPKCGIRTECITWDVV